MSASSILEPLVLGTNPATGPAYWAFRGYDAATQPQRDALEAQKKLEASRRTQLENEAKARDAAKDKAAIAGQSVSSQGRGTFLGKLGFGSGNTTPGLGRGGLFGN